MVKLNRLNSTLLSTFFLAFLLCSLTNITWSHQKGTIVKNSIEFTSSATGFRLDDPYSTIMHFGNSTYFVWVDNNYRPWVTQTTNGTSKTVPLDTGADYTVQPDGHHRFSLGVDKDGYIHITGDMHHYINKTTSVVKPYPLRYQKQTVLYWKSNQPENISEGFMFAGGLNAKTAIPGGGWLIGRFFTDNTGELYYSSQVHAYESQKNIGQMAVGLYKYDRATTSWTSIGALAPHNEPYMSNQFPVFFWEESGLNNWFQNYQAMFQFDSTNRLHFTVAVNSNPALSGLNRVVYAVSDDNGATWKKANGTAITGFPLRAIDGLAASVDVVADGGTSTLFDAKVGLAIDKNGKPAVSIDNKWRVWDGQNWSTKTPYNTALPGGTYGYRLPNNDILLNSNMLGKILYGESFDEPAIGFDYPNVIKAIDEQTLRTSGILYAVTDNKADATQSIIRTEIIPAPLPKGWSAKDISLNAMSYGGNAGFIEGSFVVTSYGSQIDSTNDSLTFVYKKMHNNGVITARVDVPESYSFAGIMMRETLASNAKHVSLLINPRPDGKNIMFRVRSAVNGQSGGVSSAIPMTPYWLRIVRRGNVFTTYASADDINWKEIQKITLEMGNEIYIGLALSSNANNWYMQSATFDNVSASVSLKQS